MNSMIPSSDSQGGDSHPDQKFLILFLGDSVSLPRSKIGLEPEDTYMHMLEMFWRKRYPETYSCKLLTRGQPLAYFANYFTEGLLPCLGPRKIDVAVVHLGVIDCAPRPLPYTVRSLLSHTHPWFIDRVSWVLHKNRASLFKIGWSFRFTSARKFRKVYSGLIEAIATHCKRVYLVNIVPGIPLLYEHSPGLRESIVSYNEIIREAGLTSSNIRLIDVHSEFQRKPDCYLTDDLHITEQAHKWIYEQISVYEYPETESSPLFIKGLFKR